jgi:hypothetical protein
MANLTKRNEVVMSIKVFMKPDGTIAHSSVVGKIRYKPLKKELKKIVSELKAEKSMLNKNPKIPKLKN